MISIVLNMAVDGKTNLSALSPAVREYVVGLSEDYLNDPEDENNEALYWFAHNQLADSYEDIKGYLH